MWVFEFLKHVIFSNVLLEHFIKPKPLISEQQRFNYKAFFAYLIIFQSLVVGSIYSSICIIVISKIQNPGFGYAIYHHYYYNTNTTYFPTTSLCTPVKNLSKPMIANITYILAPKKIIEANTATAPPTIYRHLFSH